MEQGTGIEPASEAWEATIIADILTLLIFDFENMVNYSAADMRFQGEICGGRWILRRGYGKIILVKKCFASERRA